ncbi:hypothetical protein SAMN06296036_1081, partial [Pseudobacteriovorax antillogorgiicola]
PQVITGGYNDNVTETYLKFLFNVCRTSPDSTMSTFLILMYL